MDTVLVAGHMSTKRALARVGENIRAGYILQDQAGLDWREIGYNVPVRPQSSLRTFRWEVAI